MLPTPALTELRAIPASAKKFRELICSDPFKFVVFAHFSSSDFVCFRLVCRAANHSFAQYSDHLFTRSEVDQCLSPLMLVIKALALEYIITRNNVACSKGRAVVEVSLPLHTPLQALEALGKIAVEPQRWPRASWRKLLMHKQGEHLTYTKYMFIESLLISVKDTILTGGNIRRWFLSEDRRPTRREVHHVLEFVMTWLRRYPYESQIQGGRVSPSFGGHHFIHTIIQELINGRGSQLQEDLFAEVCDLSLQYLTEVQQQWFLGALRAGHCFS